MATLTECSKQWSSRPDEERFLSLTDMAASMRVLRGNSASKVVSNRSLNFQPTDDNRGLVVVSPAGSTFAPSHHAFGQLATLAQAPAGYLRTLPAPMAADCLNFGLKVTRDVEDVGILVSREDEAFTIRAATGPRYGRVWNSEVVSALVDKFGDGITGDFRVPGEFGHGVPVTKKNTTLYASDRDMFVFLADEANRIELPNRRDGRTGSLARGFFVTNSEVGAGALKVKTFLFDYVCMNRIVWGAENVEEISIRHTASAPDRFIEQVQPALIEYANSSVSGIQQVLTGAQAARLDKVDEFLSKRFGPRVAAKIQHAHMLDEGRPIETVWDAVTGATAYAREAFTHTAERVDFETQAGDLLKLVA